MAVVYLINKCPSIALNFKTPEEIWFGHPPSLKQLKVFGCVAYAHIRQDKLEPRVVKCIFLGYLERAQGVTRALVHRWGKVADSLVVRRGLQCRRKG